MLIKGLSQEEENTIKSILEPYKDKFSFYYYGSRVKGDFRFLSDLDLMIKGERQAQTDFINDLKDKLDKSNLSFVVNISDYYNLDEHFYKLIEQDLVKVELN